MKILSITAQKPNSTGSGVYLTELVHGFSRMGFQQGVVAGIYPEDTVLLPAGTSFFPVYFQSEALPFPIAGMSDEMPYPSTVYGQMTEEMAQRFKGAFLKAIEQAVAEFQPDLILCHHLYLLTALVRERFPNHTVAAVCHGTGLRQLQKTPFEREYILEQLPRLDRVFSLHEAQRQTLIALCGISPEKIAVIGSGYNDRVFRREPAADKHSPTTLIYAGKLAEKKGVMSLIRAMSFLHEPVQLHLAGGAGNQEEYEEIRRLAAQCPVPVRFLGKLNHKELAQAFRESHVFVLPSFYEGLPLVLIEALACGLRAVSTDLPGIEDWLDKNIPGHGILFVPAPPMRNADEPEPKALPAFERALAQAIGGAIAGQPLPPLELGGVAWQGVCGKILKSVGEINV